MCREGQAPFNYKSIKQFLWYFLTVSKAGTLEYYHSTWTSSPCGNRNLITFSIVHCKSFQHVILTIFPDSEDRHKTIAYFLLCTLVATFKRSALRRMKSVALSWLWFGCHDGIRQRHSILGGVWQAVVEHFQRLALPVKCSNWQCSKRVLTVTDRLWNCGKVPDENVRAHDFVSANLGWPQRSAIATQKIPAAFKSV